MAGRAGVLPDLSTTFVYWRKKYIDALESGQWDVMSLALHNMNGTLEVEYRLPISNEKWDSQKDSVIVWKCNSCTTTETKVINEGEDDEYIKEIEVPTVSKRDDIKIFDQYSSQVLLVLTQQPIRKMWMCPKCETISSVEDVKSAEMKFEAPNFRGCIFEEPQRPPTGLMRRRGIYPTSMRRWGTAYSKELEHKMALYRIEYISQHQHDMADSGYQDEGDK
jgi:hypothetical protein